MKPTPSNELIEVFTNALTSLGGKAGNGRLQTSLAWGDEDYTWVRDHLIQEGRIKIGRGRGGSVHFLSQEEREAALSVLKAKEEAAAERKTRKPREDKPTKADAENPEQEEEPVQEEIPLEVVKARYTAIPEDVSLFSPGMKVFRPLTKLFKNEDFVWRNVPHYKVVKTDADKVVVLREGQEYAVAPHGFYTRR